MESHESEDLKQVIHQLIDSNRRLIKGPPLWRSFLTGAAGGIGATVGAAIIITILATLLNSLAGVNLFKPFVETVLPYVQQKINAPSTGTTTNDNPNGADYFPSPSYETPSPIPTD